MTLTEHPPAEAGMTGPRRGLVRGFAAELAVKSANGATGTKKRTLDGVMMPFGRWAEIDSLLEGHFLESFAAGSLDKTLAEQRTRMRCILHHGRSMAGTGEMPIGTIIDVHADREAAYYEVLLFDGLPEFVYEGLAAGEYGSSMKYDLIVPDYRRSPGASATNPLGLDELRVLEARVIEFGPTPFPHYEDATASMRSMTDDAIVRQLAGEPEKLARLLDRAPRTPSVTGSGFAVVERATTSSSSTLPGPLVSEAAAAEETPAGRRPRRYERAAEFVSLSAWALHPRVLSAVIRIFDERRRGDIPSAEEIAERIGRPARAQLDGGGDAAEPAAGEGSPVRVISLRGTLVPHAGMLVDVSTEGRSVEEISGELRAAVADDSVSAVLMDIDSPGGSVELLEELAVEVRAAREQKPVVAIANTWAASAAYWLAAQASEVVVTPSGEVGSIGVYTVHEDISAKLAGEGIGVSVVSAGKYKTEGTPFEPLTDEARDEMQRKVDSYYKLFVRSVAKGRGVSAKIVEKDFGQGRMVMADEAVDRGMADRVATFDQTVARLAKENPQQDRAAALAEEPEPEPARATTPAPASRRTRQRNYLERSTDAWHL